MFTGVLRWVGGASALMWALMFFLPTRASSRADRAVARCGNAPGTMGRPSGHGPRPFGMTPQAG